MWARHLKEQGNGVRTEKLALGLAAVFIAGFSKGISWEQCEGAGGGRSRIDN